ncbi:hypothetical protein NDU88_006462, partial [Pleurodeles waltl]
MGGPSLAGAHGRGSGPALGASPHTQEAGHMRVQRSSDAAQGPGSPAPRVTGGPTLVAS